MIFNTFCLLTIDISLGGDFFSLIAVSSCFLLDVDSIESEVEDVGATTLGRESLVEIFNFI